MINVKEITYRLTAGLSDRQKLFDKVVFQNDKDTLEMRSKRQRNPAIFPTNNKAEKEDADGSATWKVSRRKVICSSEHRNIEDSI